VIRELTGTLAPARPLWLDLLQLRVSRRVQLAIAYAVALVPAVTLAFVQPVWQLTDEAQHYDVIAQYAHGVFPQEGVTTLRPETAAIMQATGNYRWSPPGTVPRPAITDPAEFSAPPAYLSGKPYELWVRRHIWWFSYEAMQPPLFYATATPIWIAADHLGGPLQAVYAVRVLNAMALALLGPLVLLAVGLLLPSARWVAITALAVTAAMPGLLLNGTQVTNDTFGALTGSASIVTAAWMARRGWTHRTALLLGGLFGVTLLSKLTAIGILAGLAAAWAWPLVRLGAPLGRQIRFGLLASLAGALALTPWLVLNVVSSRSLLPTAAAARLMGAGTSGSHFSIWQSVNYGFVTFWTGEHLNTLPYTGAFAVLMIGLGIVSAVGIQRLVRATSWVRAQPPVLTVFLAAVAGQAAWALSLPTLGGLGGMAPGRYLYPAAAPALALFVAGLVAAIRTPPLRALAVAMFVGLSTANFAGYAYGGTAIAHEERNGPPTTVAVQTVSGEGYYRSVTVAVDRVVADQRVGSVWVHIHVTNTSPLPADWSPAPSVRVSNGFRTSADYGSSTPFPETLPGGSDYWGWIRLGVPPKRVPTGATLTLTFWDVAANHYRDVGNIVFDVALPQPVSPPAVPPAPRAA
jgi:hypothetical protein